MVWSTKNVRIATVKGHKKMGRVRIPPLPLFIVMEDRGDPSIEWVLSHSLDGEYITINDQALDRGILPPYTQIKYYAAFEGPLLPGFPALRLLIRDGRLGYEVVSVVPVADQQSPIMSRRGVQKKIREVFVPDFWRLPGDTFKYRFVELFN